MEVNNEDNMKKAVSDFNEFVKMHKYGDLMQTANWGKVKEPNWYHRRLTVKDKGEIIGTAMLLFRRIPKTKYTMCYIPRGPVFDYQNQACYKPILDEIKEVARKENAFIIKMDPNVLRADNGDFIVENMEQNGFEHNGYSKDMHANAQPRFTMITDLDKTEDEVFQSFRRDTRTKINKGEKKKLVCKEYSLDHLKTFDKLMTITETRDDFLGRGYDYYKQLLESFEMGEEAFLYLTSIDFDDLVEVKEKEQKDIEKNIKRINKQIDKDPGEEKLANLNKELDILFKRQERCEAQLAEISTMDVDDDHKIYLSGAILMVSGIRSYYLYGASSDHLRELYPNYTMQWTMMKKAMEKGAKNYDFGGISGYIEDDERHLDESPGLYDFKKLFGTDVAERVGEFNCVMKPAINGIFNSLMKARSWYLAKKK